MEAFGTVAVQATKLIHDRSYDWPPDAWDAAAAEEFPQSDTLREKSCPRGAFLGLCAEGLVVGVPSGDYTTSLDNRSYAVCAARLLTTEPGLADQGVQVLWSRVHGGTTKAHNSQMNVVLSLHQAGLLTQG